VCVYLPDIFFFLLGFLVGFVFAFVLVAQFWLLGALFPPTRALSLEYAIYKDILIKMLTVAWSLFRIIASLSN